MASVRRGDGARPGQAVAGFLLALAVLGPLLTPGSWALFVTPDDARWAAADDRWAVLLCAVPAVGAVCTVEPVRRIRSGLAQVSVRYMRSVSCVTKPSRS